MTSATPTFLQITIFNNVKGEAQNSVLKYAQKKASAIKKPLFTDKYCRFLCSVWIFSLDIHSANANTLNYSNL
jgi:hypothetical protein